MKKILSVLFLSTLPFFSSAQAVWGYGSTNTVQQNIGSFTSPGGTLSSLGWIANSLYHTDPSSSTLLVPGNALWEFSPNGTAFGANNPNANVLITSATVTTGCARFNSDSLATGGTVGGTGNAPAAHAGELISPAIDLTGYTNYDLSVSFNAGHRSQQSDIKAFFSTDGGLTYTDSLGLPNTVDNMYDQRYHFSISNSLSGVPNLTDCRIKFKFEGSNYYALIDDVTISECTAPTTSSITEVACGSYVSPSGKIWTTSNVYTDTITNVANCDSIITIDLTINTINTTVSTSNLTITATNAGAGATFKWLDCDNNYAVIAGETNASFTASGNGSYAVEITENGCTDTSACETITSASMDENSLFKDVFIYPNPNKGLVNIDLGSLKNVRVKVYNTNGQLVYQQENINTTIHQFDLNENAGVYLVEIFSIVNVYSKFFIIFRK